jgi:hypothetical protein
MKIMKYVKVLLSLFLLLGCLPSGARAQGSTIALVQHRSEDAGTATSAALAFTSNNTAGNWIGVCVRAGYSGQIVTVTDSLGNAYHKAVQFNVTVDTPNGNTLGIFYAENIAGGANTITVSVKRSGTMRITIAEYSGVASANSLDVIAMDQGNSVSPNSGNVTMSSGDLLLGTISTANSASFTTGSGFSTVESVPAKPGTKLFTEQQIKSTAGTESAHASLGAPDKWGAVLAGFKGAAGGGAKPNITSLSPASGAVGTLVTITGTNFGTALGTVTFNGTSGTPTSWSTTRVTVPVPSGATTGNVVLTDPGVPSNSVVFTVTSPDTTPPVVAITSPANNATISGTTTITASATDNVAVAGVQFKVDNANTGAAITVAPYSYALNTATLSDGNHVLTAVATDTSGNATTSTTVAVKVNNTATAPSITSLNPTSGVVGAAVTIAGANFGATQGTSTVKFNGMATTPTSWSATSIVAPVPNGAATGNVVVTVGGVASNGVVFTVAVPAPSVTSLNPASAVVGTSITINGANFGATQGTSTLKFNGTAATPTSWSAASIVAPVPNGATTGSVVVTVGGVASNGVSFTVQKDTTPPVVTITSPANNATVSGTITVTATATDPDSTVSFVQFQVDGANVGAQLTTAPYSLSLDTTTLSSAAHSLTAVAQDPAGNQGASAAINITVSNTTNTAMGPLKLSAANPHYFVNPAGKAVLLSGSHTWNDFQDSDTSASPAAFDYNSYVNFLKAHGHNVTILWRKDLPTYCNWGAGGTWQMSPFPWKRTGGSSGTQVASDGLPAFDLTQLDQTYFDRLRARVIQLQQNGIYAIVELFDGLGLSHNRCTNDGYPFTGGNNVNGVDDGRGTNSMTMSSPNTITGYQDAFVQKVIDTLNDQPNVLWEISEEAPDNSTWWQGHMIALMHTYEAGKPNQHPVGFPSLNVAASSDSTLYDSNADWVAPKVLLSPTSSCGAGTPACKVNINDSDHSYFGMWTGSAQANRNYIWENFANGDSVVFMDPYEVYWSTGNRNLCSTPINGVCNAPDSRWNNFRDNLGYTLTYANKMDLVKMTPQPSLSSTGYCLAQTPSLGAEYLLYAPNGGTFTVNLAATTRVLNVEWLNPTTGAITSGPAISGGSTTSFTPPFSGDAVLYLVDAAGHN